MRKLTALDPRGQPSGVFGRRGEPGSHLMAIFDPDTQPTMKLDALEKITMAPRLGTLDNKTVYLVDTGFAGSYDFLEEVQDWFAQNVPSVKTELRSKQYNMFADEPELWTEIKEKGDAVVFGVGG
jgi:hypothetical protein